MHNENDFMFRVIFLKFCLFFFIFQLVTLADEKKALEELWEERRVTYEQCMDLQLFYRDTKQAQSWMTKQEVRTSL